MAPLWQTNNDTIVDTISPFDERDYWRTPLPRFRRAAVLPAPEGRKPPSPKKKKIAPPVEREVRCSYLELLPTPEQILLERARQAEAARAPVAFPPIPEAARRPARPRRNSRRHRAALAPAIVPTRATERPGRSRPQRSRVPITNESPMAAIARPPHNYRPWRLLLAGGGALTALLGVLLGALLFGPDDPTTLELRILPTKASASAPAQSKPQPTQSQTKQAVINTATSAPPARVAQSVAKPAIPRRRPLQRRAKLLAFSSTGGDQASSSDITAILAAGAGSRRPAKASSAVDDEVDAILASIARKRARARARRTPRKSGLVLPSWAK